jgi:hypothetical protein
MQIGCGYHDSNVQLLSSHYMSCNAQSIEEEEPSVSISKSPMTRQVKDKRRRR